MTTAFWFSCVLVLYVYAGYPLMLACWARLFPKPVHAGPAASSTPHISIVLAARNEGALLPRRVNNLVECSYPSDRRQIVVVSDGSTDDTLAVLSRLGPTVDWAAVEAGGKALALNAAVERATGEILIFADARQAFAPDALM